MVCIKSNAAHSSSTTIAVCPSELSACKLRCYVMCALSYIISARCWRYVACRPIYSSSYRSPPARSSKSVHRAFNRYTGVIGICNAYTLIRIRSWKSWLVGRTNCTQTAVQLLYAASMDDVRRPCPSRHITNSINANADLCGNIYELKKIYK